MSYDYVVNDDILWLIPVRKNLEYLRFTQIGTYCDMNTSSRLRTRDLRISSTFAHTTVLNTALFL